MTTNEIMPAISGALLVLVSGAVGIRLLLLARRTRQLPEFTVGFGLCSVCLVGAPMMAAAGIGRLSVAETSLPLTAVGLTAIALGFVSFYVFNWKVFRPRTTWAPLLVGMGALLLTASLLGSCYAIMTSPPDRSSMLATQNWILLVWMAAFGSYLWTSIEALREYAMSRRRLALGLANPIVVNRFLLWGLANLVQIFTNGTNMVLHVQGITPSNHALPAILVALGGICCSVAMFLAFMPPAAYLRYLRRDQETA